MQPQFMMSGSSDTSESSYRRPSSMSPNQLRIPPRRDRTPIQRHRRSIPRARSHSRTEMLLPYAAEQLQLDNQPAPQASLTVVPSQSAPTTPQVFPIPPSYPGQIAPASASYGAAGGYFPASMGQQDLGEVQSFDFQPDQQFEDFYMMSRSTSSSGIPEMGPHESYLSQEPQHGMGAMPPISHTMASYPPVNAPLESSSGHGDMTIMPSRPKPQCWDHGCNGRQFSTFSNLLRHQREKSGSAMKAICPYCGTEFTRTTARNGHMYGGKCRAKDSSEPSPQGSNKSA
jgi:hypothetical protein